MSTVDVGSRAERAAADYLSRLGYDIVELNYRRPQCEIDVVARLNDSIYFVEVKYRATSEYGDGLDYIHSGKLRKMRKAAENWVVEHNWRGEYALSAIEVGGADFEIRQFIETIY